MPKNKRKDFGPKSSLSMRTGCQFTQNTSPEGPKDRPEPLQASVQDTAAEKRSQNGKTGRKPDRRDSLSRGYERKTK